MIDAPNLENIKSLFDVLIQELNILNKFCLENNIEFRIQPISDTNMISANIYEWHKGFKLSKLKQHIIKEL